MGSLSVPRRTRLRDSQEPEGAAIAVAVYSNLPLPFGNESLAHQVQRPAT